MGVAACLFTCECKAAHLQHSCGTEGKAVDAPIG